MPLLMRQCRDCVVCCSKFCDLLQRVLYTVYLWIKACVWGGVFVPLACIDVGCVRMSVCIDAYFLKMAAALKGSHDGLFMAYCVIGIVCMF